MEGHGKGLELLWSIHSLIDSSLIFNPSFLSSFPPSYPSCGNCTYPSVFIDINMRPVRISSEGPEVVSDSQYQHDQQSPDKYLVPFSERFEREPTVPVLQKLPDANQTSPQPQLYSPPPKGYDNLPYMTHDQDHERHDRGFPLLTTILLVLVAFLIGGGIAGGVGGAMVVKKQDKIAR
jgi:hypothetical protein